MKKFTWIWLAVLMVSSTSTAVFAEEGNNDEVVSEVKNPFIPQLPEKVEVVPEPVKAKPRQTQAKPTPVVRKTSTRVVAKPVVPAAPQKPQFRVTGILWNSDRPQAIINGMVVDIDDKIGQYQIKAIHPEGIEVLVDGITMTVDP